MHYQKNKYKINSRISYSLNLKDFANYCQDGRTRGLRYNKKTCGDWCMHETRRAKKSNMLHLVRQF